MTVAIDPVLDDLLQRLTTALAAQVVPGIGLRDPLRDAPTPADHYGNLSAAVALACAGQTDACTETLRAWIALPPGKRGHLPFNRLLLLMLRSPGVANDGLHSRIDEALTLCPLSDDYPSNNWTLLAAACRVLEAPAERRAIAAQAFSALIDRWTTPDGGFIDFPAQAADICATPLAYHHKALFLATLVAWHHDTPELGAQIQRLLDWAARCWDPAGFAGGLGRSTHALFGDGCLLAALILADRAPAEKRRSGHNPEARDPVTALAARLQRQRRDDGLLWLNPARAADGAGGWDEYMHLSVYNAWAAAIIAFACVLRSGRTGAAAPACLRALRWRGGDAVEGWHDAAAGLFCARAASGATLLFATRGQAPQAFSRDQVELRYAGASLAHWSCAAGRLLVPPPVRAPRAALAAAPALAGWTPLLQSGGALYGVSAFGRVETGPVSGGYRIMLEGSPVALTRAAPDTLWRKIVSALDWRLAGGRYGRGEALRRARLEAVRARLQVDIRLQPPLIRWRLELDNGGARPVDYLNPLGHAVIADAGWSIDEASPPVHEWRTAALPSSLPGGIGRCAAPVRLAPGRHVWTLALRLDEDAAASGDAAGAALG